jgi:hypothetical protein
MAELATALPDSELADELRDLTRGYRKLITTTTYTVLQADHGLRLHFSNTSPISVIIPTGLQDWFACELVQDSTGQITVVAGSSVTLHSYSGWTKFAGQHAGASLYGKGSNVFTLLGQLTA